MRRGRIRSKLLILRREHFMPQSCNCNKGAQHRPKSSAYVAFHEQRNDKDGCANQHCNDGKPKPRCLTSLSEFPAKFPNHEANYEDDRELYLTSDIAVRLI